MNRAAVFIAGIVVGFLVSIPLFRPPDFQPSEETERWRSRASEAEREASSLRRQVNAMKAKLEARTTQRKPLANRPADPATNRQTDPAREARGAPRGAPNRLVAPAPGGEHRTVDPRVVVGTADQEGAKDRPRLPR